MNMADLRYELLKSLKSEISEPVYEVLKKEADAEKLILLCAFLRETLVLVPPEEIERLVSLDTDRLPAEIAKIKNAISGPGTMKRERRLVLASVTRFFLTLERQTKSSSVKAARDFFENIYESAIKLLDQKEKAKNKKKAAPKIRLVVRKKTSPSRGGGNDKAVSTQRESGV